jgi:hypothetical protein
MQLWREEPFYSVVFTPSVDCCERVAAVTLTFLTSLQSNENYLQRRQTSLHASLSLLLSLKQNSFSSSSSSSSLPSLSSGTRGAVLQSISEDVESEIETEFDEEGSDTLKSISEHLASLLKQ